MKSSPESAIWSSDTSQRIPCFDSCEMTTTGLSNIKDAPMVMVLVSLISQGMGLGLRMRSVSIVRTVTL